MEFLIEHCFGFLSFMCRDDSSILFSTFVCVCKTLCIQSYLFDPAKPHFVPVGLDTRFKIVLNVILSLRAINTITLLEIDR